MARFLSAEWLAALGEAATGVEVDPTVGLTVAQEVTGGPDGPVSYGLRVRDGTVTVLPGRVAEADADVRLSADVATAAAIARGELSAGDAFLAGHLRFRGDVTALVRSAAALAALEPALARIGPATTY